MPFVSVMHTLRSSSLDGRQWNANTLTPFYNYVWSGQRTQVNYDDPWSMRNKYQLALYLGVRGVGSWFLNCMDFSDDAQSVADRDLMWSVIPTGQ